ncbi:glycoside hydrolase family 36 protein [Quadrisphaera sp. KR29]|uniref:glycoside hydrolase family 36 protein n=1 Tax=Quadrisphaera sp. KR29 TaxID=3461391 RepID=UPI004043A492
MLRWSTGALELVLTHRDGAPVRLVALGTPGRTEPTGATQPLVEVLLTGDGRARTGPRLTDTGVGRRLRYASHHEEEDGDGGRSLVVVQRDEATSLQVSTRFTGGPAAAGVRVVTAVRNTGPDAVVLEAVSTLATGAVLAAGADPLALQLHTGRSEQVAEFRWSTRPLYGNTGLADSTTDRQTPFGRGAVVAASTSSWSTARHLPTAVLEHPTGRAFAWQVEHSGGWRWEVGDVRTGEDALAVVLSGPSDLDHQWARQLAPGEDFTTVPASVAVAEDGGFDGVLAELTRHRRWLRRRYGTPVEPVPLLVFNDYMNTLDGDPTTERLLPLVAAAAEAGAEAFCIDAGWYDDTGRGFEAWWRSVGEWVPSTTRFPDGGLARVLGEITRRGMRGGLWLEPEVVGVESPVAAPEGQGGLPDAAFLQRHGLRVHDDGRYFLDLRHPAAVAHLDACVDRLVGELGVGFFKLDFNVTPGPGTDREALSAGDGLLEHQRAHLAWLRGVRSRHPHLVVENCASGAMRADFAVLELLDLQSTTDQEDFRLYPPIAAGAPAQVLPEQCGNWAYPQAWMSAEEVAFTQVTGLAGRLYQAGRLDLLSADQLALVHAATALWKDDLRHHLVRSVPVRPLGHPVWDGDAVALGLSAGERLVLAVWHRGGADAEIALDLPDSALLRAADLVELYPRVLPPWSVRHDDDAGRVVLRPGTAGPSARLFEVRHP